MGQNVAVYEAIEYTGSTVEKLSMAGRMVLCNMAVEMGVKTSYIQPDSKTINFINQYNSGDFNVYETDSDFRYSENFSFNVENLSPQIALPHAIDNVTSVGKLEEKIQVDQVFIGTCTGGRLEDIKIAAEILEDQTIATNTRLIVTPASTKVLNNAISEGYIESLTKAGATLNTPGCGPCLGAHQGVLAEGEVCLSTSSRNFPGRMGSVESEVYSVSPATAAASAYEGEIVDPINYL